MNEKALEGVKVIDLGWILVSPLIVKTLADYGATVICVESMKRPDLTRTGGPYKDGIPGVNRAGYFAYGAANKYSISLDLRKQSGMEVVRRLISWTDVVSENRRAGIIKEMGLGYDELKEIKPDIIMISSTNQGQTGPYAAHPGLGIHLNGLGGFNNFVGWPGQEPTTLMVAYTDYITPPLAVAALVAALDHRRKTGEGQFLDISQLEAGLQFLAPPLLNYSVNGIEPGKSGNSCDYAAPHGIYKCKGEDRWCAIAVFDEAEWDNFCRVIGYPDWVHEPRFSTLKNRKEHENELNKLVELWTIHHTAEHIMTVMQDIGVAAGVVQNANDICQDPQLQERELFWVMDHKELGEFTHLGEPAILSSTPARPYRPAPCLGEHTEYICKELLGLSDDEFSELLIDGAFGF